VTRSAINSRHEIDLDRAISTNNGDNADGSMQTEAFRWKHAD